MTEVIVRGNLDSIINSNTSLVNYISNLVSVTASATSFSYRSNSVGGFVGATATGFGFTFDEPYSNTSSLTRTFTGGTITSLTFDSALFGRYGGNYGSSITFSNISLPFASVSAPSYLSNLLDGNDVIRLRMLDTADGPTQMINFNTVNAGSGDDIVIDEMVSSTITPTGTPGNPFNRINLGTGNDTIQISQNNRSFEITTGVGNDIISINYNGIASPTVREIVVTDFNVASDELRIIAFDNPNASLRNTAGGVNVLSASGQVLAFLQNVTASQLSIEFGVVRGSSQGGTTYGTDADNILYGTDAGDDIRALGGNDQVFAGAGDDYVDGGNGSDILYGQLGADNLVGGEGNDYFRGDEGGDRLNGGAGSDRADYYNSNAGVSINLAAGTASGGHAQGDLLIAVESVYGSSFADVIIGSNVANTLYGNTGNDQLYGLAGNDVLYGQAGNDFLRGDAGADIIDGGAGIDRADYYNSSVGVTINLTSGAGYYGDAQGDLFYGIENLYGSAFDDVLAGSAESNIFYGNSGNDRLFGLAGNDVLEGQAGNDALYGGSGNDVLGGGDGVDGLFGDTGNDTIYGGNGDDYLAGGDGNDVMSGDVGNDQIDAGAGNDFVVLGLGNDGFTLGAGDDRVRFDYGNGQDTIFDFGNGHDVIDFSATDMTVAALQANAVDTAAGVLLQVGSGTILLAGLQLYQIEWNYDFAFAA
jgi:Ca2+-binding RTX toxin-like protein